MPWEVRQTHDLPVADDDVRFPPQDGGDQRRDVRRIILAVGIQVDDDVRSQAQGHVKSGLKGGRQPPVPPVPHDDVRPRGAGDLPRPIGRAVIHHQDRDPFHPRDLPGDLPNHPAHGLRFVIGRDLNHNVHGTSALPRYRIFRAHPWAGPSPQS